MFQCFFNIIIIIIVQYYTMGRCVCKMPLLAMLMAGAYEAPVMAIPPT